MSVVNPFPQHYWLAQEGIGGVIKQRPEDFVVEELPLYEPTGEGEHLYLRVEKINVPHGELMSVLRRYFRVPERSIGYAGMKDKIGVTRQTISLHVMKDPPSLELPHQRINVLWAKRHRNKLRRGHLIGNRFIIKIRQVDPNQVQYVRDMMDELNRRGMPNYYGPQRFGYRANNHILGAALLREQYQELLDELLGSCGSSFPEYQRRRRESYDARKWDKAAAEWSVADQAELKACNALCAGKNPGQACQAIGSTWLKFMVSALTSAIFNRVLERRLEMGDIQLLAGDLAFKYDSRAVFLVTEDELKTGTLDTRLKSGEITPSGPIWGDKMTQCHGDVGQWEHQALEEFDIPADRFSQSNWTAPGMRRPLLVPLKNTEVDGGSDEHGPYISVAFELTRGSFATVALREIMKVDMKTMTQSTS